MSDEGSVVSLFVTVDGPNGVGKTTFVEVLTARLRDAGADVLSIREPSNSELGDFARSSEQRLTGMALAVLVVADRYLQIETVIRPALNEGKTVVCNRYVASTLALQRLDDIPLDLLWSMNAQALVPDLSVLLMADPEVIEGRLAERDKVSRFERMPGIAVRETAYFAEAFDRLRAAGYATLEIETTGTPPDVAAERALAYLDPSRRRQLSE
jgi:dTMP kinase